MRPAAVVLALLTFCSTSPGGDQKKPPSGWKEHTAKDKSFAVWLPDLPARRSEQERTLTSRGIKIKVDAMQFEPQGGPKYLAATIHFPVSVAAKIPEKDRIEIFRDSFVADVRGQIEAEADVKQGRVSGREYLIKTAQGQARLAIFASGGRIYQVAIVGSETQTESPDANTFLDSFKLMTPVVTAKIPDTPKVGKAPATKPALPAAEPAGSEAGKQPVWTLDVSKMQFPEAPPAGKILGGDFKMETVKLDSVGVLTLRQGTGFHPDLAMLIFLGAPGRGDLAGKTFEVAANAPPGASQISIHLKRMLPGQKLPMGQAFGTNFAMKLEFGEAQNGVITGRIYASLPDQEKSVVAGTFSLPAR